MTDPEPQDHIPVSIRARDIAPPLTISPAARQALSEGAAMAMPGWPAPDDMAGWRERIGASDALWEEMAAPILASAAATVETVSIGGVPCHDCLPERDAAPDGPARSFSAAALMQRRLAHATPPRSAAAPCQWTTGCRRTILSRRPRRIA
ncbi:putative esterase [Sphingobium sp. SYK-6]|nr:putative esterase [Sphingobium sp. SYK-6]